MLSVVASLLLALVLVASPGLKLGSGPGARARAGHLRDPRRAADEHRVGDAGALEAGLAVRRRHGGAGAAWAAAALFAGFTAAQAYALMRGRAGARAAASARAGASAARRWPAPRC